MSSFNNDRRKVLLVGWDSADWKLISPLIDAGCMPNLAGLVDGGVMGNLSSLAPLISPVAWTSIATGQRADQHGVLNWTEPDPSTGVLRPVSSATRSTPALWNMVGHSGLKTHVVNWYATHPVDAINGVFVSDRFADPVALQGESWPVEPGSCEPQRVQAPLAELRLHPGDLGGEHLLPFVPRLNEIDQQQDLRVAAIAAILAQTVTVHAAATWILEHERWDFLAAHYRGIEQWAHGFLRYAAPAMPGISRRDRELYGQVIPAGYRFYDMMLGRLLQLAGADATVILVSDHGVRTGDARPRGEAALDAANWHRGRGIFCMSGPGIRRDELIHGAGVLDITPTILTLFNLPVGDDMAGRPLLAAWAQPPIPKRIASWDALCPPVPVPNPAPTADGEFDAAIAELEAQGYADDLDGLLEPVVRDAQRIGNFHLAIVHLSAGRAAQAMPLLAELHRERPEVEALALYLAYCDFLLGQHDACRELLSTLDPRSCDQPLRHLLLAMVELAEQRPEKALEGLHAAQRTHRREPLIACFIGHAYLQLKLPADAEQAFKRALQSDEDCAEAHFGLALSASQRQDWEAAADAALGVVALNHEHPRAHFLLGTALARMGRPQRAIQAFETALAQRPDDAATHGWLAAIHDQVTQDAGRAAHHRSMAQTARRWAGALA